MYTVPYFLKLLCVYCELMASSLLIFSFSIYISHISLFKYEIYRRSYQKMCILILFVTLDSEAASK